MGQAARAYQPRYERSTTATPQRSTRPNVRVVEGGAKNNKRLATLSPTAVFLFKVAIALSLVFAVVCIARVWLSVATVQSLEHVASLEKSIDSAIDDGKSLEITHAVLSSPTRIEKKAKALGMVEASNPERLKVKVKTKAASSGETSTATAK